MAEASRRVLILYNPVAGRRRPGLLAAVTADLERRGFPVDLRPTTGPGDAEAFGREVSAHGHAVVVAAGGDGTINGVVNGLMQAAEPVPPLALLPLGTANVLALEMGLPLTAAALAATIAEGCPRAVYPGCANGRHFLLMAGVGFDAWVVDRVRPWLKRLLGKGAYVAEALWQAVRYPYPEFTVQVSGGTPAARTYAARTVIACKGRLYGGRHILAPAADLGVPSLEICLLPSGGPLAQMRYGLALARGRLNREPGVTIVRGNAVRITCAPAAASPVQCDGDITCALADHTPLTLTVAETPLWILGPRKD